MLFDPFACLVFIFVFNWCHLLFCFCLCVRVFQSILQMIAIIYYQQPSTIGIISILMSLLSVAIKALMFSQALVFSVFIFNWLSLVIDFFGIFCMLSWVFYNPDSNGDITTIGYIWIYQALIMWGICCLWFLVGVGPDVLTKQSRATWKKIGWSPNKKICAMSIKVIGYCFVFVGGCAVALLGLTIGLFSPFAFVCPFISLPF